MEVAVVADEVLGTDGGVCIQRVRFEVLDCKGHVRTVRIDYSAAESAARVLLVVHSETVPARSDGPGLVDLGPTTARALSALSRPRWRVSNGATIRFLHGRSTLKLPGLDSKQQPFG